MNPEKAQIKILTVRSLGADMEDAAEATQRLAAGAAAAKTWLGQVMHAIDAVAGRVDADLQAEKIGMDEAAGRKDMLQLVRQSVQDIGLRAEATRLQAEGKAAGIKHCMAMAKKAMDAEEAKLRAAAQAGGPIESGPVMEPRPRTMDAAEDLRQRKAEAKAAKEAAKAPTKRSATKRTANGVATKRRRGRPPKAR